MLARGAQVVSVLPGDDRELLARGRFFGQLSPAQVEALAGIGKGVHYPADTRIYTIGDAVDHFFVLAEGQVRFTLGLGKRETAAGDIIRSGEIFGWAALVEGSSRRIATAYCLTPCRVLALDGQRLRAFMDRDPGAGYLIMKQLAVLLTSELTSFAAG